MARTVGMGIQDFAEIVTNDIFYIDKTNFIKEWWESRDSVTLITRPRRFGKTLNLNMLEYFFSIEHQEKKDLFERFSIWKDLPKHPHLLRFHQQKKIKHPQKQLGQ